MKKLNVIAPINNLGYGIASTNIIHALSDLNVEVKLWPIGHVQFDEKHRDVIVNAANTRHGYSTRSPSLRIWHQFDLAQHVGSGIRIGFPIFELNRFTNVEIQEMRRMDMLMVCSHWAKIVLDDVMPCPVCVVPLGVDRDIFHEYIDMPDPHWTTFLNIGKWEYRKGHDVLIEAFNRAFEPSDRVRLWMMPHNPFLTERQAQEWTRQYKSSPMGHRVSILPRVDTHSDVAFVMSQADCGVFPSRAEGWNLELLEMMSIGRKVITTNYSGHTEFCSSDNSLLIDIDDLEIADDGIFFNGENNGEWAKFGDKQMDQLVESMRAVHKNRQMNKEGIETAKEFTWKNTALEIVSHIGKQNVY